MTCSKLRIGIVSPDAPPHVGGMGRHVGSLVDALRLAGAHVDVFDRSARPFLYSLGKNVGFSLFLGSALRRFARSRGIDILHVHTGPGGAFVPFGIRGIPLVVTAHHTYAQQSRLPGQGWKRIFIPFERGTYVHAERIVCVSEDTAHVLTETYGVDPKKISIIHNGFDLTPWISADLDESKRESESVVFVGRPDVRKGWDLLQEAWNIVHAASPNAVLHVVGFRGEDRGGIRFHGRLADTELRSLVGASQIAVVPSRMEGFGLVAAEAIAAGTPVVATNVDGLRSVVDHCRTGLLMEPEATSIAAGMLALLKDGALRTQLRDECRTQRGRFDGAAETAAHMAHYDAVYSGPCIRS